MGARKRLLLLLLLLLAAAALLPAEGSRRRHGPGSERGVKLCGRLFVRAVIFTCGGSRWKRSPRRQRKGVEQPALSFSGRAEFVQTNSDSELENTKLQSVFEPELEQLQSVSQSTAHQTLNYLFNLYGEYMPTFDHFGEYIHPLEDSAHKKGGGPGVKYESNSMVSNKSPWIRHPRRKRNLSMGVAEMCCRFECTKTEISKLC